MPCDHFTIRVPPSSYEPLIEFLTKSLAHLGFKEHLRPIPEVVGMGEERPYLWLDGRLPEGVDEAAVKGPLKGNHIAFTAKSVDEVKKFHEEALKAGGKCNGPPGPRPDYHPGYYAAFVNDPAVGLNLEVVYHTYSG
ncbi:hypothetical protein BGZ60DRAFT_429610 [Tricladium varicosporioides]|nr:hypothetical protein BGZ60DRAFT_429610 [Hymenoscyphus varicosporioides]